MSTQRTWGKTGKGRQWLVYKMQKGNVEIRAIRRLKNQRDGLSGSRRQIRKHKRMAMAPPITARRDFPNLPHRQGCQRKDTKSSGKRCREYAMVRSSRCCNPKRASKEKQSKHPRMILELSSEAPDHRARLRCIRRTRCISRPYQPDQSHCRDSCSRHGCTRTSPPH